MELTHCRICNSSQLTPVIDLGTQPWGNHFLKQEEVGKEPSYPLCVVYCESCQLAQLNYTVKKEVMFADHTYLSGMTQSLAQHFWEVAKEVDDLFFKDQQLKSVLDIGSNDGTQLLQFKKLNYDVLGVESSRKTAEIANGKGIKTMRAFFNLDLAKVVPLRFDVINASGVFFHLEELHSVCKAIKLLLKDKGVFVVQFIYMRSIQENLAFDQIYHEHLLYYTLETLNTLLKQHGLSLFDAKLSAIHGGSVIAYAGHTGARSASQRLQQLLKEETDSKCNSIEAYHQLSSQIATLKQANLDYLKKKKQEGKRIFGLGAPVKGNTLLNTFGIGRNYLDYLVEKNHLRKGLFSPGQHLEIVLEDELMAPPDVYYVLAWNFRAEILKRNQSLIDQGVEFYFPIIPKELCAV